ncbi:hypothetical protein M9H77_17831 [Catharanthus roseus]|uniref:Uncharacterized protein n=1 Tax=Catharanthus roseus TaxID=4058 RepID=A0ACC0B5R4_CATRO|nr:hypothetical protein M9H77_17831 [Catharanthus roseus]
MIMYLLMDTMTCRFNILILFMTMDIMEDHDIEVVEEDVYEEEDTIDHKKSTECKKHGMMRTFMKIMDIILMLAKHTMIENQRKRVDFSTTNLPSSRNLMPKPPASSYKSWPKKKDTPKVTFKDHSKPKSPVRGPLPNDMLASVTLGLDPVDRGRSTVGRVVLTTGCHNLFRRPHLRFQTLSVDPIMKNRLDRNYLNVLIVRCGGAALYASPSTGIHAMNSSASDRDASPSVF